MKKQMMSDADFMAWMAEARAKNIEVTNVCEANYDSQGNLAFPAPDGSSYVDQLGLWQNRFLLIQAHGQSEKFAILVKVYDVAQDGRIHQFSPWMTPAEVDAWIAGQR